MIKNNTLRKVVIEHIEDLRKCVPMLRVYKEMASTADEVEKAANELQEALDNDQKSLKFSPDKRYEMAMKHLKLHPEVGVIGWNALFDEIEAHGIGE